MTDLIIHILLICLMPPLLLGVISKTKAAFAGRNGAPYFQPYYDLGRLFRKGMVISATTTWLFCAGPVVTLATTLAAALLIPLGNHAAPVSFDGDVILFAYLLAMGRFATVLAALDTGSSFEGMGSAREATYACLTEPTLFFVLVVLARLSGSLSFNSMFTASLGGAWVSSGASLFLLVAALFIILLAENCRIPFDDPATHLELTMIHEVMVLDHSGPLLGCVLYGAALKLFILGALFVQIAAPIRTGDAFVDWGLFVISMIFLAMVIGTVESVMARLRLTRVPQILIAGSILSAFALLLILR